MATEPTKNGSPSAWTMGLAGNWKVIANLTAVGLICLLFYQLVRNLAKQVEEERIVFREELKAMRVENSREWEAIRATERAVQEFSKMVRDDRQVAKEMISQITANQRAMESVAVSVAEMVKSMKALQDKKGIAVNPKEKRALENAYCQELAKAFTVLVDGQVMGDAEALARFQKGLVVLRETLALALAADKPTKNTKGA